MPLYTLSGFAKLCGKSNAHVSVNVKRGTLIKSGDYIDTDIYENKKILERWSGQKVEDSPIEKKVVPEKKAEPEKTKQAPKGKERKVGPPVFPPKKESKLKYEEPETPTGSTFMLDVDKKTVDIQLSEARLRKLELEEAKLRGLNIPTELVRNVITILGKSFQTSYLNGASMILMDVVHKGKISAKIEGELKGELIKLINDSHASAIENAKRTIKSIIENNGTVQSELEVND